MAKDDKKQAYQFIVLMGMVSLFGDITYEGARSVSGPFLALLGAGAGVVGLVAGLGEFMGYAMRIFSGYLADRTRAYWLLTFIGYGLMFSIPALAFAGHWQAAAGLFILERLGKAVRTPARDAMLSYAASRVGRGWGFALHELMDQVGAIIGPLVFTAVFFFKGDYRQGFSFLWIPALFAMFFLARARRKMPEPRALEAGKKEGKRSLPGVFRLYALFTFFSVAGVASFPLIAYHLKVNQIAPDIQIPVLYIVAMGADAVGALAMGRLYDRKGLSLLIAAPLLSLPVPFLAFAGGIGPAVAGVALWGVVIGMHETIMRAAVSDLTEPEKRGFAYGAFNAVYGLSFFVGSALMGFLYEISVGYLIGFAVAMEVMALGVFVFSASRLKAAHH